MEINDKITQQLVDSGICLSRGEARRVQLQMRDQNTLEKFIEKHNTSCGKCIHLENFGYGSCCHPESLQDSNWHIEECYRKSYKHKKVK